MLGSGPHGLYTPVPCLYWPPGLILLYKRLCSCHLATPEPAYNINWNAGSKCADYFSSLFVLPFQDDQCNLLRPLVCITGSQDMLQDCICLACCLKLACGLFDALCLCCRHRDCTFLDLSVPITLVEKIPCPVSTQTRMPFFVYLSMSFKTVS